MQDYLKKVMKQPYAIDFVVIIFDDKKDAWLTSWCVGIPFEYFLEDNISAMQSSALVADLVMKTECTLKQLNFGESDFLYLRMRT